MAVIFRFGKRCSYQAKILSRMLSTIPKMAQGDEVLLEMQHSSGLITLNRPKALNALNLNMIRMLHPVLKTWEEDQAVGVIVMKGAGEKSFCAGGDVRAIAEQIHSGIGDLPQLFFKEEYKLNLEIGTLNTPFVALIDGITMGGGVGLSVHSRYRVASGKTLFAMPETAIGLFPDVGGGHFLPRLQGNLGMFLALTGYRLKARDVLHAGIATHFVSAKEIPYLEDELLTLPNPSDADVRNLLDSYHSKCEDKDVEFSLSSKMDSINKFFSADTLEDIFKALETDGSEWAIKQLEILSKMSPISMKVSLRQLKNGAQMNLADVLKMEYRISQQCTVESDFYEGVRAVLIDKDFTPKWKHSRIEDVSDEYVNKYFQPLSEELELKFDYELVE